MPRLFRRKFCCFYCGCRSAQEYSPNIRQWKCESCDAANYLDENGEITDPPPLESFSEARYARAINPNSHLPVFPPAEGTPFCARCLRNQKFLTEALASYFPPTNAPDYPEYEEKYPEFRRNLEDRYPQVCHQCEPHVQARIAAAGYAANADGLGRVMERSRDDSSYNSCWTWEYLRTSAGALGWWASQIVLMMWSIQGSLTTNLEEGLVENGSPSTATCMQVTWAIKEVTTGCAMKLDYAVRIALTVGLVTIWWNPVLQQRLRRRRGRIIGKKPFYTLQTLLLGFRYASFSILKTFELAPQVVKAINAFLMVIAALFLIISFGTIKLDNTPNVSSQNGANTTRKFQRGNDADSLQIRANLNKFHQPSAGKLPLSLNDLAPLAAKTQRLQPALGHPPTPPPDEEEAEAMDWTPSQKALPPAKTYLQAKPAPIPSPFYGRLPAAPKSQAHKLRNPTISSSYPVPSERENFFSRQTLIDEQDEFSEIGTEADALSRRPSFASTAFAPPRFFPLSTETDTGLESIFSGAFNIEEIPHEVRAARQQNESTPKSPLRRNPVAIIFRLIFIFSLCISVAAWSTAPNGPDSSVRNQLSSLSAAIMIAFLGIMLTIRRRDYPGLWIDITIYSSEICFSTMIGSSIQTNKTTTNGYDRLRLPGLILLCGMILHQCLDLVSQLFINTHTHQSSSQPEQQQTQPPPTNQGSSVLSPQSQQQQQQKQSSPPTTPKTTLPSDSFARFATIVPSEDLPHSKRVTRSKAARIENNRTTTARTNTTPRFGGLSLE